MSRRQEVVGSVISSKSTGDYIVVDYENYNNVIIKFLDKYEHTVTANWREVRRGNIKNPYYPTTLGVGYLGFGRYTDKEQGQFSLARQRWRSMMTRSYSDVLHRKEPAYVGCSVAEVWHNFQNFGGWYVNHKFYGLGYDLDKDLLFKGNKIYSPEKCTLLPREVNRAISIHTTDNKELPRGICFRKDIDKYAVAIGRGKLGRVHLGTYETVEEAFDVYKKERELYVKDIALEWKDNIESRAFGALMNWTVD